MGRMNGQIMELQKTGSWKWKDRKPLVVSRQSLTTYYLLLTTYGLRLTVVILITTYHLLLTTSGLYGAFKDSGWGTRPAGMGGAFTAVSDDSSGMLYNPAGVYQLKHTEVNFMHAELYTGLETVDLGLKYAAFVCPLGGHGSFGANWANFVSENQYSEDTINLTYAASLLKRKSLPEISYGFNIKQLRHAYVLDQRTAADPVFTDGDSKSAVTADIGLWSAVFSDRRRCVSIGAAAKNITHPDVGLKTKDTVPTELRLGIAYKLSRWGKVKNFLTSIDTAYRKQEWGRTSDKVNLHLGAEAWFAEEFLGVRLGGNYTEITSGVSFKIKILDKLRTQLDYAFLWPLQIQETAGSHRVSLSCQFGALHKEEEEEDEAEDDYYYNK